MRSSRSNTVTRVAGARELLRTRRAPPAPSRSPRRACPVRTCWRLRHDPALSQACSMMVSSTCLIVTGSLLMPRTQAASHGAGTEPAGELREVVRRVQPVDRLAPLVAVHEVVPVGDDVARAGSPGGRTGCRSPCSVRPASAGGPSGSPRRPPASRERAHGPAGASASRRPNSMNPVGFSHCATPAASLRLRDFLRQRRSSSTRRYSRGITFTNFGAIAGQSASSSAATRAVRVLDVTLKQARARGRGLRRRPASRGRSSPCCSALRSRRPRRTRTRCRRSCPRQSCGRSCR